MLDPHTAHGWSPGHPGLPAGWGPATFKKAGPPPCGRLSTHRGVGAPPCQRHHLGNGCGRGTEHFKNYGLQAQKGPAVPNPGYASEPSMEILFLSQIPRPAPDPLNQNFWGGGSWEYHLQSPEGSSDAFHSCDLEP